MFVLLIRGVTLDGAELGLKYYLLPDWSKLLETQVGLLFDWSKLLETHVDLFFDCSK